MPFVPVTVPIELNADFWNFLEFMSRGYGLNANVCDFGTNPNLHVEIYKRICIAR